MIKEYYMNIKGMFMMCLGLLMMLLAGSVVYFGKSYFEYKLREE